MFGSEYLGSLSPLVTFQLLEIHCTLLKERLAGARLTDLIKSKLNLVKERDGSDDPMRTLFV